MDVRLRTGSGRRIEVIGREQVGDSKQFPSDAHAGSQVIFITESGVCCQIEVTEIFVHIQHDICIGLLIFFHTLVICSFVRLGMQLDCRSMQFTFGCGVGVIHSYTSCYVQPAQNVVFYVGIKHITFLFGNKHFAVHNPVRVFQVQALVTIRPFLYGELAVGVISFVHFDRFKIFTPRKEIQRYQRIKVTSCRQHVLVTLQNITGSQVEMEFVIQHTRSVAQCEVITIVFVVGDDAGGIRGCHRYERLIIFVSY